MIEQAEQVDKCISFETDFEFLEFDMNDLESEKYLKDDAIILIRFINKSYFSKYFPDHILETGGLHKFFFLPSHKEKEIKEVLKSNSNMLSEDLKEYLLDASLFIPNNLQYFKENPTDFVIKDYYEKCARSTSLYVLFHTDRFLASETEINKSMILRKTDFNEFEIPLIKDTLLKEGLNVSRQIPLTNFFISIGFISTQQGILEWGNTILKGDTPSSHVNFFKVSKKSGVHFQDVANQFFLLDKESFVKSSEIPKRQNSKRRKH